MSALDAEPSCSPIDRRGVGAGRNPRRRKSHLTQDISIQRLPMQVVQAPLEAQPSDVMTARLDDEAWIRLFIAGQTVLDGGVGGGDLSQAIGAAGRRSPRLKAAEHLRANRAIAMNRPSGLGWKLLRMCSCLEGPAGAGLTSTKPRRGPAPYR